MAPSQEQNDWVERVLGVHVAPSEGDQAALTALTTKAGKVGAPRPNAPPKAQTTNRLLGMVAGKPAPSDPADAPAHVAAFLPGFLVAVETERPAASQRLEVGEQVSAPDQILGIADLFAAAQRSMIEWEAILDQAETTERRVDIFEDQTEERDEDGYSTTLATYNTGRSDSIAAEERGLRLMAELQAKFNSLSESQQTAALQQAHNA